MVKAVFHPDILQTPTRARQCLEMDCKECAFNADTFDTYAKCPVYIQMKKEEKRRREMTCALQRA